MYIVLLVKRHISDNLFKNYLENKSSKQALIRSNRMDKSFKIIEGTCSSIRDMRVHVPIWRWWFQTLLYISNHTTKIEVHDACV